MGRERGRERGRGRGRDRMFSSFSVIRGEVGTETGKDMEGIQRVYDTGFQYAKKRYVPNTALSLPSLLSLLSIVLYTLFVFILTEYLMRGQITRWLYIGSVVMVISMVYSGSLQLSF